MAIEGFYAPGEDEEKDDLLKECTTLRAENARLQFRINDLQSGNHDVINQLRRVINDQGAENARLRERLQEALDAIACLDGFADFAELRACIATDLKVD